jgi:hypothetical protein
VEVVVPDLDIQEIRSQGDLQAVLSRPVSGVCLLFGSGPEIQKVKECVARAGATYASVYSAAWIPSLQVLTQAQRQSWHPDDSTVTCFLTRSRHVFTRLDPVKSQNEWDVGLAINDSLGAP